MASFYYYDTFCNWFISDDAAAIVASLDPAWNILFSRGFSHAFYTPLVAFSFKPDVLLFGLSPMPYHIHNTVLLVLIAFMTFKILGLFTGRISSFLGAIVVLFSTPSLVCLLWLVLRQYLYGMLFSLMALYLYLKYKPDPRGNKILVTAILVISELSFIGKEQYMTIPFVLFIVTEGNLRRRIWKTHPYFLLITAHFFLRLYILGGVGGYIGARYDPWLYMKTTVTSILTAEEVLFGHPWIAVPIVLPLLLRPRRIMLSIALWLSSLSISFIVMSFNPVLDTYRYWLIPTILFAFAIGFASDSIRHPLLKAGYLLLVSLFFLLHTVPVNKEMKTAFKRESLREESVSKCLTDSKYIDRIILYPEDPYIIASSYIDNMAKAYDKIARKRVADPFFPLELIASYPGIVSDFRGIYEIRENEVIEITDSIVERIKHFQESLIRERPEVDIFKRGHGVEMKLNCMEKKGIAVLSAKNTIDGLYGSKTVAPYFERLDITPFIGGSDAEVELIPREKLTYCDKKWYVERRPLINNALLVSVACFGGDFRETWLSDILIIYNHSQRKSVSP